MKAIFSASCLILALIGAGRADEKRIAPDATKIIGLWEVVKSPDSRPGAIVEFTKDGKLTMTFKAGEETKKLEATYAISGDRLTTRRKENGREQVNRLTIQKLDDTTLITVSEKGATDELRRK